MKKKLLFIFLGLAFFALPAQAQDEIWQDLMSVKSIQKRDSYTPKFEAKQRTHDGKKVTLSGYMYAYEEAPVHKFFMLSFYPVSMCFFCGGAGPETVIEVTMKKPFKFTSRKITLTGTLQLNQDDPERLFYFLLNAEEE
jgi:hypothetical protein